MKLYNYDGVWDEPEALNPELYVELIGTPFWTTGAIQIPPASGKQQKQYTLFIEIEDVEDGADIIVATILYSNGMDAGAAYATI